MIWANLYREMDAELEDGAEVILEGDIDYWVEGGKINLKLWEVIVVELEELTNRYPVCNHAVG